MGFFEWVRRLFGRAPETAPAATAPEAAPGNSPFPSGTGPARVLVMRHAEKSGDKNDPHLSLAGRRRAEWLVEYVPATFGQPDFLLAARTSNRSRRPVETLEPLAAALALEVRAKFDDGDSAELVKSLGDKQRYSGKLGVICWRHGDLPRLIRALGAPPGSFPERWDESDYTTVLDITYPGNGEARARRLQMPQ